MTVLYLQFSPDLKSARLADSPWVSGALALTPPVATDTTSASLRLLSFIASSPAPVTRTELNRRRIVPRKFFDVALKNLVDGGAVLVHNEKRKTRPATVFVANPHYVISIERHQP